MRKRDILFKPFRKDRTATSSPKTPDLYGVTASSAPAQLSALVRQRPIPVKGTEVNPALELAIQKHFNDLPKVDKDAFQEASKQISQDNLLSNVKAYDDAHKSSSSFRPRTKDISKFLSLLNRCMAGISTTIQANPGPSSIIVGAAQLAISLAVEFVNFFDRLTDMLNCFNDYLGPLAEYAKVSDTELMRQTVASIYGDLLKFCSAARHVFLDNKGVKREWISMRTFLRVQWEPFEGIFGDIEANFKHHLDVLHHSAKASNLNAVVRLEKQQKTNEREAFLEWISKFDFEKNHEDIYATKHPGTGDWLIHKAEFQAWLHSPKSSLLWCHGKPGAGKSVLMSNIVEYITTKHALRKDTGICFAYYDYKMPDLGDPCHIISALIKQLCRKKDAIPPNLLRFKNNSLRPSFTSMQGLFISLATSFDELFLIIDALDECLMDKRHHIIGFLIQVIRSVSRAKVFITSRKESDITDALECEKTPIIKIEAENVTADIRSYVTSEVQRLRHGYSGKRLNIEGDALEEKIIRTLSEKAEGMFLWVNLQLENLCSISKARKDRLVEAALEHVPRGLDSTYKRIIRQIDDQEEHMKVLALRTFVWVLYAKQPLRTAELRDALATDATDAPLGSRNDLDLDDIEVILEACANLLMQENDIIRPIHYSVQEFFTNPHSDVLQGSCLDKIQEPEFVHRRLARACIFYLNLGIQHQGRFKRHWGLYNRLENYPFLFYSARFFDYHVKAMQDLPEDVIQLLEALLRRDGLFLAAVLQIRSARGGRFNIGPSSIDPITILYSTQLYDITQFNTWLADLHVPRYTLHSAAINGYLPAVIGLIERGCNIDENDDENTTPLHIAAVAGHELVVKELLEHGAGVNIQGGYYGTALQAASHIGNEAIVSLLLEHGTEVNAQAGVYNTALQAASIKGNEAIVSLLLEHGAEVNIQGGYHGTALQAASIIKGNEAIVSLLLNHGAEVNIQGGPYGTALQAASYKGNEAIVSLLLEHGAEVNIQDGSHGTALQAASIIGNEAIVSLLLERGAFQP